MPDWHQLLVAVASAAIWVSSSSFHLLGLVLGDKHGTWVQVLLREIKSYDVSSAVYRFIMAIKLQLHCIHIDSHVEQQAHSCSRQLLYSPVPLHALMPLHTLLGKKEWPAIGLPSKFLVASGNLCHPPLDKYTKVVQLSSAEQYDAHLVFMDVWMVFSSDRCGKRWWWINYFFTLPLRQRKKFS